MATRDNRRERTDKEYSSFRQSKIRRQFVDSRELLLKNRELLRENRELLLAIIKHLEVPYEKPPMGFRPE